jgi:hypothetical protein
MIAAGIAACESMFLLSAYDPMKHQLAEPKPESSFWHRHWR